MKNSICSPICNNKALSVTLQNMLILTTHLTKKRSCDIASFVNSNLRGKLKSVGSLKEGTAQLSRSVLTLSYRFKTIPKLYLSRLNSQPSTIVIVQTRNRATYASEFEEEVCIAQDAPISCWEFYCYLHHSNMQY